MEDLLPLARKIKIFVCFSQILGHFKFGPPLCFFHFGSNLNILAVLWNTYDDCKNYLLFRGHKGAITDISWQSDNAAVYSSSSDKTVGVWDTATGRRTLRLTEHSGVVNSVSGQRKATQQLASAADDGAIKVWDTRHRKSAMTIAGDWPLCAVAFHDTHNYVFAGGLENEIFVRTSTAFLRLVNSF